MPVKLLSTSLLSTSPLCTTLCKLKLCLPTLFFSIFCLLSFQQTLLAQEVSIAKLQAVFVGKLINFVESDSFKDSNLKICLEEFSSGPKPEDFSEFISELSSAGTTVNVVAFEKSKELHNCTIVISNNHLSVVNSETVLKIALNAAECSASSHLRLFLQENKIRFAVNMQQIKIDRFQLSSKLLTLAKIEDC